jgi:signal transduction histidine kinase
MLYVVIVALTAIANIIIAAAVYKRNPKSVTHQLLASLSFVTALWSIFNYLALQPGSEATRLFWVRVVMFVTTPYGTIIYLLAKSFPEAKLAINNRIKWFLIVFNILTAGFALSPYMFTSLTNMDNGSFSLTPGPAIILFAIAFMGIMTAGFIKLIQKLRKSSGVLRQQLWLFLLGLIISFTLLSITNFVAVVVFGTIELTALGPPLTLILFFFVVYAIAKHKFLDISYLIARSVSYSLLLLIVVSAFSVLLFASSEFLPSNVNHNLVSAILAVVLAFSFNPLREVVERATDKFLLKQGYNTEQVLSELTNVMAYEINIKKMASSLLEIVINNIRVTGAAFMILEKGEIATLETNGLDDKEKIKESGIRKLAEQKKETAFLFDQLQDKSLKETFSNLDLGAVFVLRVKEQPVGLLLLGPKASGEFFTNQDLELFDIFAPQAAVALQNAQSYKTIQRFNKTLEKKVDERTSELKQAQKRELSKAKELLKLKDDFVFVATHDLGTPVTAVKGYSSLLKMSKEKFSADTRENIDALVDASERLDQLTNDLLQVARSDAGTIEINPVELNFTEVMQSILSQIKLRAKKRKILIDCKACDKKVMVKADKDKLAEVLENLFSNAVKYNKDKGSITISVEKGKKEATITVADTGIGIPKDLQKKVFSKFFRAQQNGAESVPGTGLGLFVVKMLVEKMGGNISFESAENKGTTFTFTLPLA